MRDMEAVWKALAQPIRREIMVLVRKKELTAGEIAAHFSVSRPAISQHLGVLRDSGLLLERRQGTKRLYSAELGKLEPVRSWLLNVSGSEQPAATASPAELPSTSADASLSAHIDARPASVWRLLVEPSARARWKGEPSPELLEQDAGRRLRLAWRWRATESPAQVELLLEPSGSGTRVTVEHDGPDPQLWEAYLDRLQCVGRGWDPGPEPV
jgi:DNA-binding transcriptional ArsR family regulator